MRKRQDLGFFFFRSWFRQFKVCVAANEWDEAKKFKRVLTLLKGQAWAVYEALTDEETDTYDHLKWPSSKNFLLIWMKRDLRPNMQTI